jgi:hypothetical protein
MTKARDAVIAQLHEDARRVADAVNLELDDLRTKWNAAERKLSAARRAAEKLTTARKLLAFSSWYQSGMYDAEETMNILDDAIRALASPEKETPND